MPGLVPVEAQGVRGVDTDEIVDVGPEGDLPPGPLPVHRHLDREEGRVLDRDADALDRRDEHEALRIAAQDRGEQLYEGGPADRRAVIEPGSVGGDAHVDVAAERRVPALDRRRSFRASGGPNRGAETIQRTAVWRESDRLLRHVALKDSKGCPR